MSWMDQTRERLVSNTRGTVIAIVLISAAVALVSYSVFWQP